MSLGPGENPIPNAIDDTQQRVFEFLAAPVNHGGLDVTRIDTHGAAVFLAGPRALKIKRAVKFPYLDYSTLARRKAACDQELDVNRAFAPQIYRGLVPIRQRRDGQFSLGGDEGDIVEWALEMTRFDERRTVDQLACTGALDYDLACDVADAIAASHRTAPVAAGTPWIESIARIIAGNTAAFRAGGFEPAEVARLDAASRDALARNRPLLERRAAQGQVRRCHGDLHLENIVVIDGKPVLFDALEFDPVMASTDVLYDLAFALMDCLHYGRADAANWLFNRYLAVTGDDHIDALAGLPLMLSMRAAIRGNVLLSRPFKDEAQRQRIRAEAKDYCDLALRLITPPPARLVAVGGLSGTGKSRLARDLAATIAPMPGAVVLRSDVARKAHFGVAETDRLPPDAYQPAVTAAIYRSLGERAGRILAQGQSVLIDAVFARADERAAVAAVAAQAKAPFRGLFLVADLKTRLERIAGRTRDASDATAEVATVQQGYDLGPIEWPRVDASGTPDDTLARARLAVDTT